MKANCAAIWELNNLVLQELELFNECKNNDLHGVRSILQQNPKIDLTAGNGDDFLIVIKHNNAKILELLLNYYEDNVLKKQPDSLEYYKAKKKLQDILEDAIKSFDISEEIQSILDKHLEVDTDSDESEFAIEISAGCSWNNPEILKGLLEEYRY